MTEHQKQTFPVPRKIGFAKKNATVEPLPGSHGLMDRAVACEARWPGFDPGFIQVFYLLSGLRGRMESDTINLRDLAIPKQM